MVILRKAEGKQPGGEMKLRLEAAAISKMGNASFGRCRAGDILELELGA